jgi:hypothetical protein
MMSSESRMEFAAAWLAGAFAEWESARWLGDLSERFRTGDIRFRSCTKEAPERVSVIPDAPPIAGEEGAWR